MKITVYQSTDNPNYFLAHAEIARDLFMPFFGATAAEARERAETWHRSEKARWARVDTSEAENRTSINPRPINKETGGKETHWIGKAWMINRATQQKLLVPASEVASYEAKGFFRGGARTQLHD